jgi:uncharacterized MAPEG superfamily protein
MSGPLAILLALSLPYIWTTVAKHGIKYSLGKNHEPRRHLEKATGYAARANWAQMNAWEAFSPFAAAILCAMHLQVDASIISFWSVVFLVSRFLHGLFYVLDFAILRSLAWTGGITAVIALLIKSM